MEEFSGKATPHSPVQCVKAVDKGLIVRIGVNTVDKGLEGSGE